jgi:hypothetical protein
MLVLRIWVVLVVVRTLVLTCGVRTTFVRTVVVLTFVFATGLLLVAAEAIVGMPTKSATALMAAHKTDPLDMLALSIRGTPTQTRPDPVTLHRQDAPSLGRHAMALA